MPEIVDIGRDPVASRRVARPRNRRGEGVRLRAEILAAATGLLDRDDGGDVTLRAVARAVGIAAPSIYPHFPDRPALVLAVVREAFSELSGRLVAAVEDAGDVERGLYAACYAYLDFAAAHPGRYRAMYGGLRNPVVVDDLARLGARTPRLFAGVLADCVAAGRSNSTDPSADAVALWLGLHGLAHQLTVSHAYPWPDDFVRRFVAPLSRTFPSSTASDVSDGSHCHRLLS
ncbi:TetR/AcrR family transcriptional regulator [Streptomyces sp. NBC_01012]|uniref:TetR/AcrR family transcriptional regulator n=1 Tax=Streptomyces sp. NBC_01012 TaxID=2903717 RepID=UPI00386D4B0F|nr:TetR/AcrR family transcriptional regulator [Streptomyces sp. NBC_01012]